MLPRVNQMLHYHIASADEEEAAVEYRSRIADELEDCLLIENPINDRTGRFQRLFLGDELSVYYMTDAGVKNYFDSHVLGFAEDVVRLIKITKPDPEKLTKIQRRNFLRVPAELEIAVKLSDRVRFVCKTDDVGGGGISFICEGKWSLMTGQTLDCWLLVPYKNGSIEHATFKAEIVRVVEMESGRLQAMIKFISISDGERQKIIRYCFEKQLEYRNR